MELIPWRPFGEGLSEFHTEMDKLRNRFMSGLPFSRTFTEEWSPFMDILETKDKLIVKADLPGEEAVSGVRELSTEGCMIPEQSKPSPVRW